MLPPLLSCAAAITLLSPLSVFAVVTVVTTPIYGSRHEYRTGGALPPLNGYIATPAQRLAAAITIGRKPQRLLTMARVPEPDTDVHLALCSLSRAHFRLSVRARSLLLLLCCRRTIYLFPPTFRPRHISSLPILPARLCNATNRTWATLTRSLSCSCLILTHLLVFHSASRSFRCIILTPSHHFQSPLIHFVSHRFGIMCRGSGDKDRAHATRCTNHTIAFAPHFPQLETRAQMAPSHPSVNNCFIHSISLIFLHTPLDSVVRGALASLSGLLPIILSPCPWSRRFASLLGHPTRLSAANLTHMHADAHRNLPMKYFCEFIIVLQPG
ncbi:hypothetical protein K438DRAFT_1010190 [Mycena galopus ATCC 62051]|nr:hypothetical protein K438DRAFT_1010190 [Mycena galopus ATCC 62051]